jgi:hypothetical protein
MGRSPQPCPFSHDQWEKVAFRPDEGGLLLTLTVLSAACSKTMTPFGLRFDSDVSIVLRMFNLLRL